MTAGSQSNPRFIKALDAVPGDVCVGGQSLYYLIARWRHDNGLYYMAYVNNGSLVVLDYPTLDFDLYVL